MPELPEVETIRRGLAKQLKGRRIDGVDWRGAKLRSGSPTPLEQMEGRVVEAVDRHGKYLHWHLSGGYSVLVHLGMTGKLLFAEAGEAERSHTHLVLSLDDEKQLRFSDPRRFGCVKLFAPGTPLVDLAHFGKDALDPKLTAPEFADAMRASRAPIKAFLLDQTQVAGVGNIYAAEALWRTGISPRRRGASVPRAKALKLLSHVRDVLRDSIASGGTSFNDYVDHIGQPGKYVAKLAVYDREGQPCPRCATAIRRISQANRSTFYCPTCQT